MLSLLFIALVVVLFIIGFVTSVKLHRHIMPIVISWLIVILPTVLWILWAKNNNLADISGSGLSLSVLLIALLLFTSSLALYLWGWVKKFVLDYQINGIWPLLIIYIGIALSFAGIIFRQDQTYDFAFYSFIISGVIMSLSKLIYSLRFWVLQLVSLLFFILYAFVESLFASGNFFDKFNATNLLFGFAFIGLFLVVFNWLDEKWATTETNLNSAEGKPGTKNKDYSFSMSSNKNGVNINNIEMKAEQVKNSKFQPAAKESQPATRVNSVITRRSLRPSTKLATTFYNLKNRRQKDYILQESYFKMPIFKFDQTHQATKNK
jgi:hypothetical protein